MVPFSAWTVRVDVPAQAHSAHCFFVISTAADSVTPAAAIGADGAICNRVAKSQRMEAHGSQNPIQDMD